MLNHVSIVVGNEVENMSMILDSCDTLSEQYEQLEQKIGYLRQVSILSYLRLVKPLFF